MDCIAQQVLVLRRPNKSLQQVWCPTKLSRLQLQMQLQPQQLVQLRMLSRVTKFRVFKQYIVTFWLYFFLQLLYSINIFFVQNTQYTQHVYFLITCAWAKTRKTSLSYYLPDSFLIFQCPLQKKKNYMRNKYSPYFLGDECSANYFSGDTLKLTWHLWLKMHLVLAAVILSRVTRKDYTLEQ